MALFTDTNIVTEADLLAYEGSLDSIVSSQAIDLPTKICLATSAIGDRLLLWLLDVRASDRQWLNRRLLGLTTVVVTSLLHRWLCFETLSRVFAEAANSQLNTRFEAKLSQYQEESGRAANAFFRSGAGIVYRPLPRPAVPLVSVQSGPAPAQTMEIQTAWVNSLGQESGLSAVNEVTLAANSSIAVAMSEAALNAPPAAIGWNIYAAAGPNNATRQNTAPVAVGASWELPSSGLVQGPNPIDGQQPDFYIALSHQILRG